jgi:hypothetical protein
MSTEELETAMESLEVRQSPLSILMDLPEELLEGILEHLSLQDIISVRLANRELARRCVGRRFEYFISQKATDLTGESIASLLELANHPFGALVKCLIINAVYYDSVQVSRIIRWGVGSRAFELMDPNAFYTEEDVGKARQDINWLKYRQRQHLNRMKSGEAITQLTTLLKALTGLQEISLDAYTLRRPNMRVATSRCADIRPIFSSASRVFAATMVAIARSGVSIKKLSVFKDTGMCSVQSNDVTIVALKMREMGLSLVSAGIEEFSISMATNLPPEHVTSSHPLLEGTLATMMGWSRLTALPEGGSITHNYLRFAGPVPLLQEMPELKSLHIHLYNSWNGTSNGYSSFIRYLAANTLLPKLQHCSFRGLKTNDISLCHFLTNHPTITYLEIHKMECSDWDPVYAELARMPNLEKLALCMLSQRKDLISLEAREQRFAVEREALTGCWLPCSEGKDLIHTRTLGKEEIQAGLQFRKLESEVPTPTPMTGQLYRLLQQEYGPPLLVRLDGRGDWEA